MQRQILVRVGLVLLAVMAGVVGVLAGLRISSPNCTGARTTITVVASPGHADVVSSLAEQWTGDRPAHNGRCLGATVVSKDASAVAAALSPAWDSARDGTPPDVWSPDSSLWLAVAANRPDTAVMLPSQPPSIASSPVVLALQAPLAQAMGWPNRTLEQREVLGAFAQPDTWKQLGHPEFASLRVGMVDPSVSTAGLAAVLAVLDPAATGAVTDAQLLDAVGFSQILGAIAADPATFFAGESASPEGQPQAPIAAFQSLERDIAVHNATKPDKQFVPVYAQNAVAADYPYAIVNAGWVDETRRAGAEQFLEFLLSKTAADRLAEAGLRSPRGAVRNAAILNADQGFPAAITAPRPTPSPTQLSKIISEWTALQRPANVLLALDTSGSMNGAVPGTNLTRLQLLQQTATAGFGFLTNQTTIGLWEFSAQENDLDNERREVVALGPITGSVGSVPRQQALIAAVARLRASGFTPLYNTVYAAFREHQRNWRPDTTNAVLIITDGEDQLEGGLTLDELVDRLTKEQNAAQPVKVIGIAVGPEADAAALERIAVATGGRTFVARDPAKAVQTLILAFAGRLG
jgi:Ca-activated chloride channel family protein